MEEEKSNKSESGELIIIGVRRRKEPGFRNLHKGCSSRAKYYRERAKYEEKASKER